MGTLVKSLDFEIDITQYVPMADKKKYHEIKVRPPTKASKDRYEVAARKAGQSLSKWMLRAADAWLAVSP